MRRRARVLIAVFLFAVCIVAAIVQAIQRQQRDSLRPAALFDVVSKQYAAFRIDDYAGAYEHVSTGFQERFTIASFTDLVRSEYPQLGHAERVEFGPVHWDGRHAVVPTYFFLADGAVVPCLYSMVQENIDWRIDSIRVLKPWPAGKRLGGTRT